MNINEYLRSLLESDISFRAYPQDNGGFSIELIDQHAELFYGADGTLERVQRYQ